MCKLYGGVCYFMVNVDINRIVYEELKKKVNSDKVKYPSVKFLVHKLIMENMEKE